MGRLETGQKQSMTHCEASLSLQGFHLGPLCPCHQAQPWPDDHRPVLTAVLCVSVPRVLECSRSDEGICAEDLTPTPQGLTTLITLRKSKSLRLSSTVQILVHSAGLIP